MQKIGSLAAGTARPAIFAAMLLLAGCANPPPGGTAPLGSWQLPSTNDFLALVPPPPRAGSEAQRLDVDAVLALQAKATPARIARAQWTYELTAFTFGGRFDPNFTPARYPLTKAFFERLNEIVKNVNDPIKDHFRRPHPFEVDPRIRRFVVAPPGYSYPSFHSARCAVFRRVLDMLDPADAAFFDRIAQEVEQDRVFAGEHFPTDIDAGSRLGRAIFDALQKDPAFRADLARLKVTEWTPAPRFGPGN